MKVLIATIAGVAGIMAGIVSPPAAQAGPAHMDRTHCFKYAEDKALPHGWYYRCQTFDNAGKIVKDWTTPNPPQNSG